MGPGAVRGQLPFISVSACRWQKTPGKSQTIVIHDLKFEKYFANRVANLTKWQTTPKETKGR